MVQCLRDVTPQRRLAHLGWIARPRAAVLSNQVGRTRRIGEEHDAAVDHERYIGLAFTDQSIEVGDRAVWSERHREAPPIRIAGMGYPCLQRHGLYLTSTASELRGSLSSFRS